MKSVFAIIVFAFVAASLPASAGLSKQTIADSVKPDGIWYYPRPWIRN